MHEKEMHLVIVPEDFSSFAHVHPTKLGEHTGLFGIKLNAEPTDADNLDVRHAVQKPGRYFVYSESMPMGYDMTLLPIDVIAEGPARQLEPITPDPLTPEGKIIREIDGYRWIVTPSSYQHCGQTLPSLELQIQEAIATRSEASGVSAVTEYRDVTDLDTWLAAFGHAIILSAQGERAADKSALHLHAVWPLPDDPTTERGPYVSLTADNHSGKPLIMGVYRGWIQLKHRGRVLTQPFTFELKPATQPNASLVRESRC